MTRQAGKFGRKPPINKPRLMLGEVLTGVVPDVPATADYLARFKNWQMLGNDQYGDCVAVTWGNERRLLTGVLGEREQYPSLDQVLKFYKTQNPDFPSQDDGMVIQTALETLVKDGGPDGVKALAFAQVNHNNPGEVKAAISIFGSVWTGITVDANNMDEFNHSKPWDYDPNSWDEGGHSVITGGYGSGGSGALSGDERFITWAAETSFTDEFWKANVDEAWVVIWPEHLGSRAFQEGVDLGALSSAYTALTGRPFPVSPGPGPIDPDVAMAAAQRLWEGHALSLAHPRKADLQLGDQQRRWREQKGL